MGLTNQNRGLRIAGTRYLYLDEGFYGVVFADKKAGCIVKVYKRAPNEPHIKSVFESEIDAYERASKSKEISELVPGKFQLIRHTEITDNQGRDVTGEFFPDFAFATEFIDGYFHKIGGLDGPEASRVKSLFKEAGINHTSDMSVTLDSKGRILKAIDFATEEHELTHEE